MKVEQDKIDLARHYVGKARDRFDDGLVLKNMDRYESAASNRHRGVKTLFDMHYIKTDIMNRKYSKLYNTVLEVREDSDYEDFYIIDKSEVDTNFTLVKEFIDYTDVFISKVESGEVEV